MTHMSHEGNTSDHLSWWLSQSQDRVLPHPSDVFHAKTSTGSPWVARTLSLLSSIKRGKISSNLVIVKATKFTGHHKSHMCKYIINAYCNRAQPMRSLIDTGRSYHLRSSEYENRPLSLFPIRYSPLSPSCPARSRIEPTRNLSLTLST
jgi:hypothetical protein